MQAGGSSMNYNTFRMMEQFFATREDLDVYAGAIEDSRNAYAFLIASLDEIFRRDYPRGHLHEYTSVILHKVIDHLSSCLLPGITTMPDVPVLRGPATTEFVSRITDVTHPNNPGGVKELSIQTLAALLFSTQAIWSENENRKLPALSPLLLAEFNSYGMWKDIEESKDASEDIFNIRAVGSRQTDRFESRLNGLLDEQRTNIAALVAAVDETKERLQSDHQRSEIEAETLRQKFETMNEALGVSSSKLDEVAKIISTTEQNVAAFSEAVREELKIDATKKLWEQRASDNSLAFWLSAALIAIVIVVPASLVLCNPEAIVHFLERITEAATPGTLDNATTAQLTAATISKIVIISAPLAVYFWAIKLIVRFNTRCMLLMDDARQRHTTMDTYFHLIEKDGATTEERGLMLNALFRPLVGQGQDNVEPPNFIELVGKGKD
jgi:hypothetical protein